MNLGAIDFSFGRMSFSTANTEKKLASLPFFVVAGGRPPKSSWLKQIEKFPQAEIFCADHGIDAVIAADLWPTAVFGDADSAKSSNWQKCAAKNIPLFRFEQAKDATDLQLLLEALPSGQLVIATGVWGGRFDHLYANIFSLLACKKLKQNQIILADEEEVMVLLTKGESVTWDNSALSESALPFALSLLPFAEENQVSISGVRWPLQKTNLKKLNPYAISNEMREKQITVQCHSGEIGFYLKF